MTKIIIHGYNNAMDNFFQENLKELCRGASQSDVAARTGFSTASVSGYITGKSEPSLKFLLALKKAYGISVDDFISSYVQFGAKQVGAANEKFIGSYIVYYYDSSVYKGKASNLSKNTLRYGTISVYKHNGEIKVISSLLKSREEAEKLLRSLEGVSEQKGLKELYAGENMYEGSLESTNTQIFIDIKNVENNDKGLIILNNPPSNKQYIGGLGTANSVSRGREHMPCLQFMIVSRYILSIPDGEIYNLLALGMADVNVKAESEQLYKLFQNLSSNSENLTEYQKQKIFEDSLSNLLLDLIDANMFRFAKVSGMEDDTYYRMIREEE